jgi:hypothetical protein
VPRRGQCYVSTMRRLTRPVALALAVLAVIIGVVLASEARLNLREPRCRYWHPGTYACAERVELLPQTRPLPVRLPR